LLAAAKQPAYAKIIDHVVAYGKKHGGDIDSQVDAAVDRLLVEFGSEILKIVPGRVSTEVDARLSFDKKATVAKALRIIKLYEELGVDKKRILIKIAGTYEGIQAARELEKVHGVHCNVTLLFSFVQAVACAEAGVTLISPFVGRILDWYRSVGIGLIGLGTRQLIRGIMHLMRILVFTLSREFSTISNTLDIRPLLWVCLGEMRVTLGASFRNTGEILELSGCDYLTIAPALLDQLQKTEGTVVKKLDAAKAGQHGTLQKFSYIDNEPEFRFVLFHTVLI
jgi:transaldolase